MRTRQQWLTYCQLELIPIEQKAPSREGNVRKLFKWIRLTLGQRLRGSALELHRDAWHGLHWQINDREPHRQMQLASEDDIRRWIDEHGTFWSANDRMR